MKLGSWLIAKGHISGVQLKRALLDQSFYGRRLSSSLMKLGCLDESLLGEYLSELFQVPYASPARFENIPDDVLRMVPRHLAEKYQILPLGVEGKKLQLAMMNPKDILVADEVAFLTGLQVSPWVSSEELLLGALERYHQVHRQVRETIPIDGPPNHISAVEDTPPRTMDPPPRHPSSASRRPPGEELGLDGLPLSAPAGAFPAQACGPAGSLEALDDIPPVHSTEGGVEPGVLAGSQVLSATDSPSAAPSSGPGRHRGLTESPASNDDPALPTPAPSLQEATQRMRDSCDRDQVFDALLSYSAAEAARVAVFVVIKEQVLGWSGRGDGLELETVRQTRVPFDLPSIFSYFRTGSEFYFGPVPDLPANRKFFTDLSITTPPRVLLVPIHIKGRLVAILYGEPRPGREEELDIGLFRRIAQKASLALEILILRNKLTMI